MAQFIDIYDRVWGDGDITNYIEVSSTNNLIAFEMNDGTTYEVGVPSGNYAFNSISRTSNLVNEINLQCQSAAVPIRAYVGGVRMDRKYNCIVFQSTNSKKLVKVSGSFTDLYLD